MDLEHPSLAQLAGFLGHKLSSPRTGQQIQIPDNLVDALMQIESPIDSRSTNRITPIVEKAHKLHQTLHTDSLRCLARVLLVSSALSDRECALRLLLHDSADTGEQSAHPSSSTKQSQLIQRKFTSALCSVFLDESWDLGLRRLTGKLLVESLLEPEDAGEPELECLKITAVFCLHTDTTLRFFAGAVLRLLYRCGADINANWAPDNAGYRSTFLRCLQDYPDDWPKSFYFYTREVDRQKTQASCHAIKFLNLGKEYFADRFMLATTTSDTIAFIIPANKTARQSFQLLEVPLRHILRSTTHGAYSMENKGFQLRLHLGETGVFLKNGNQQQLRDSMLVLISDEDLAGLWAEVQNASSLPQDQSKKRSMGRRTSSVLIHLDTGDEIAEKSGQGSDGASCMNESMAGNPAPSTMAHEANTGQGQQVADPKHLTQLESRGVASPNGSQRSLQLPITRGMSSSQPPVQAEDNPVPTDKAANSTSLITGDIRNTGPNGFGMASTGPENGYEGPSAEKPGEALRKRTRQASTASKNKAPLPNTQESLIFPRPRRAKRKVYTTPSNDAVDWDEDLRPSDDGEKTEAEKDFDFTSVSSPFPSDNSAAGRIVETERKKRKSATSRKGGKGKNPAKRKKAKTEKKKSKGSRLPLHQRGSSADNEQGAKPAYQDQKGHNEGNGDDQGNACKDDAGHEAKETESLRHTPQSVLSTHESVSPCKSGFPFMDGESEDGNLSTVRSLESLLDATVRWSSPAGTTQAGSNWNGIAKGCKLDGNECHIDAKVKPNFRGGRRPGRGNELGQKLAAAFFEAGDNPDDSSLKNHGISPSNRKDKQPQMSPQGDQDRVPQSELLSVSEVDTQQAGLKPGDERLVPGPAERAPQDYPGGEPLSATMAVTNAQNGHRGEQETVPPVTRKRAADDDQDELPNKKHRTSTFEAPLELESKGSAPQPHASPQLVGEKGNPLDPNPDIEDSSWVTEEDQDSEEDTQLDHPGSFGSEDITAIGSSNTPTTAGYSVKPPPKTIVDANGSPRLCTRYLDWQLPAEDIPGKWQRQHSIRDEQTFPDECRPSWADYSDSDATEYNPLYVSTFRDRVRLYFGEDLVGRSGKKASSESESGTSATDVEQALSVAEGPRASPVGDSVEGEEAGSVSTPVSTSALDADALEAERGQTPDPQAPFGSSVENPLQLEPELTGLHTYVEGEDVAGAWQTSLQAIQRTTDRVLLSTSQDIMRHVQHEREAINRVLELYVQGCHRVLDRLFQAQEERIAGYRQQMGAVQEHQAGLCRGLMRRLEGNPPGQ